LVVYPKFSWTERDNRSDEILKHNKGNELSFFWKNDIPIKIFGDGVPYKSDGELMNNFYLEITK
jgi:hypothetical protein